MPKKKKSLPRCQKTYCENIGTKLHECPYQSDVNNDPNFKCNCCTKCQEACADDI